MIVTVIVPCRNEARYIDGFLNAMSAQQVPNFTLEFIIADGMSDDGTTQILKDWCDEHENFRLVENLDRIVSSGLNAAVRAANGSIIVRMDVHTLYAEDYVAKCVDELQRVDTSCVGGAWVATGSTPVEKAIAEAFMSPFGSGGARSRQIGYEGFVDTVYLGAWRKRDLLNFGGFDEQLVRNQDDELSLRIIRSGGRIYQSPLIRSNYIPRGSFSALLKQFYQYGFWKLFVVKKHRLPASIRHLVPAAFVICPIILIALGAWRVEFFYVLALLMSVYLCAACAASWLANRKRSLSELALTVIAYFTMHTGYGAGFAHASILSLVRIARAPEAAQSLSR